MATIEPGNPTVEPGVPRTIPSCQDVAGFAGKMLLSNELGAFAQERPSVWPVRAAGCRVALPSEPGGLDGGVIIG